MLGLGGALIGPVFFQDIWVLRAIPPTVQLQGPVVLVNVGLKAELDKRNQPTTYRDVAQLVRALGSYPRGHKCKSCHRNQVGLVRVVETAVRMLKVKKTTELTRMGIVELRDVAATKQAHRLEAVPSRVGVNIVLSPLCRRSPRSKMNGTTDNAGKPKVGHQPSKLR